MVRDGVHIKLDCELIWLQAKNNHAYSSRNLHFYVVLERNNDNVIIVDTIKTVSLNI